MNSTDNSNSKYDMSNALRSLRLEMHFAGGLVADERRPDGLLAALNIDVRPNDLQDILCRNIFAAALLAQSSRYDAVPTSSTLAQIIMSDPELHGYDSYDSPDHQRQVYDEMVSNIDLISRAGADQAAMLNNYAVGIRQLVETRNIMEGGKKLLEVARDDSMVPVDKYNEMAALVESLRPNSVEAREYGVDEIAREIRHMTEERVNMIGKLLMSFPPKWGITKYVPNLVKSYMYVISGLTGRGKTAILMELADFLASCGYFVLYFHLEDNIEKQIDRMARHSTGALPLALRAGDPDGKYYPKLVEELKTRRKNHAHKGPHAGTVRMVHCPSALPSFIASRTKFYKPDVIIVDYLGKINLAPYMKLTNGSENQSLAMASEAMKLIAEDPKSECVVVLGAQEAEYDQAYGRKGTAGSRQTQHKGQVVIEFERVMLKDSDEDQEINGIKFAESGKLSPFGTIRVHKYNDGETGPSHGVFNGITYSFESLDYRAWKRNPLNRGKDFPLPVLNAPAKDDYIRHEAQLAALEEFDLHFVHPALRKKQKIDSQRDANTSHQNKKSDGSGADPAPPDGWQTTGDVPF